MILRLPSAQKHSKPNPTSLRSARHKRARKEMDQDHAGVKGWFAYIACQPDEALFDKTGAGQHHRQYREKHGRQPEGLAVAMPCGFESPFAPTFARLTHMSELRLASQASEFTNTRRLSAEGAKADPTGSLHSVRA
jgi:hypothetical protein